MSLIKLKSVCFILRKMLSGNNCSKVGCSYEPTNSQSYLRGDDCYVLGLILPKTINNMVIIMIKNKKTQ